MNTLHDIRSRLTAVLVAAFLILAVTLGLAALVAIPSGLVLGGMVTGGVIAEIIFAIFNLLF